jgi:hypothetical protein
MSANAFASIRMKTADFQPDRTQIVSMVPLLAILLLQLIVALSLRNSAFQDEALYLYAGRDLVEQFTGGSPVLEPYSLYFSGLPYLYPVLAGALDVLGGLEAARSLSLFFMLLTTALVYMITNQMFDRNSAAIAAALFAVQGSVLFLSRLATYDAMSLGLLAIATWLALRSSVSWGVIAPFLCGVALFLAVATKYAGLLWVPTVMFIVLWHNVKTHGWWQGGLRVVLVGCLALFGVMVVLFLDKNITTGVSATTTNRDAFLEADRLDLVAKTMREGGIMILLGFIGIFLVSVRRIPLALVLFGSALLAPAYHIYKTEVISMHKHIAFGMFFAAPLAGYTVARLSGYRRTVGNRWLAALAICLMTFNFGLGQAQNFYSEWPNAENLVRLMRTQVRPGGGRILAEVSEVTRYYLWDVVESWQWNQLYWFYYRDESGQELYGTDAYKAALREGYFSMVVLSYSTNVVTAMEIDDVLHDGDRYELLAELPYITKWGPGTYYVWRLVK